MDDCITLRSIMSYLAKLHSCAGCALLIAEDLLSSARKNIVHVIRLTFNLC